MHQSKRRIRTSLAAASSSAAAVAALVATTVLSGCVSGGSPAGTADASASPGSPSARVVPERWATLTDTPGNLAVSPDGRVFVSMHPFGEPSGARVFEIDPSRPPAPFPPGWSGPRTGAAPGIASIIGIECDADGRLWMLDAGGPDAPPRVVAWDLSTNALHAVVDLPRPVSREASFIQDLAIDLNRGRIYLADAAIGGTPETGEPALIVVDLATKSARRVLEGHRSVMPEDVDVTVAGIPATFADGSRPRVGVNPIEIGPNDEWVYFGAMNGRSLYRVRAAALADDSLPAAELGASVERHGDKPVSDGIGVDVAGNVYVTDLEHGRITITTPDGRSRPFTGGPPLAWPDGMSGGPDGWMYVVVNQLHRHPALSGGEGTPVRPFEIVRFRPAAPLPLGR
ncbi:MAG: L-dopachrome tautomerase-related protein [Phycisphaerales bacterium]